MDLVDVIKRETLTKWFKNSFSLMFTSFLDEMKTKEGNEKLEQKEKVDVGRI